jgi:hypothetical protein
VVTGLVYTANIGDYDTVRSTNHKEPGLERHGIYDMPRRKGTEAARMAKIMTPCDYGQAYDWTLWLDGTFEITKPIMPLIEKLLASKHDFAAFKHNEFGCAYQEIDACIERRKDTRENLDRARKELKRMKFPRNYGQAATGVLWRRNTERVREHAKLWWEFCQDLTMRDQCSFMAWLWVCDAGIEWIPGLHTMNPWFRYHRGHK